MSSKHFINDPTTAVTSALNAITLINPNTALDRENKILYLRPDVIKPQVSIVSGGGSGHEPAFAAFVGPGLLSAAVAGTIFASPSAEQVRRAILERVDSTVGVLVIVMQYTGDVLNFGMAVEKAKAAGKQVEMVVVGDDVAVGRTQGGKVGRRGIAGTVLVQKIAGAMAATGASLVEVARIARLVAENVVSMGASLQRVHVPGRSADAAENDIGNGQVELGMGIHNEPGVEKSSLDLPNIVKTMLRYMLDPDDTDRGFLSIRAADDTVLLINNLGGVSVLEMGGIVSEVVSQLAHSYSIQPIRVLSGTFMTSLNGLGFSISLLRLHDTKTAHTMLSLLDAPAECTGYSAAVTSQTWSRPPADIGQQDTPISLANQACGIEIDPVEANRRLERGLKRVIAAEPEVTHFDTIAGDGDCGIGLKRGAEAILDHLGSTPPQNDLGLFLDGIIDIVENAMDGTSGALYAIFLNSLVSHIRSQAAGVAQSADAKLWSTALQKAMRSLEQYTPAKPGDRTVIDSLRPFVDRYESSGNLHQGALAAKEGAEKTRGMKASLGRAVYIGDGASHEVPDPGAYGLAEFLTGLAA